MTSLRAICGLGPPPIKNPGYAYDAECLRKNSPNKRYLPKQTEEDQLKDLELDGPITLRILDGIAWDFAQAK